MRQASLEMLGEASHAYCNDAFPPYTNFRYALEGDIVNPAAGGLGGSPASPAEMRWLWPLADTDEDKVIVNGFTGVGAGQVGLFAKLNGTEDWTDPMASKPYRSATLPTPHPKT